MIPRLTSPLVLVHGLFGWERVLGLDYFFRVRRALERAGNAVLVPALSPTGGVEQRASQLAAFLRPHPPAHLFAHSMGGLDARFALSRLRLPALSLTTLGMPHRGSIVADWAERSIGRLFHPVLRWFGLPVQGFLDLTTAALARFNAEVPDVPGIRYRSIAGEWRFNWLNPQWHLTYPHARTEGPNDGLISVASARWGESCEVWDTDHMGLVGWPEPGVSKARNDRLPQWAGLLEGLR